MMRKAYLDGSGGAAVSAWDMGIRDYCSHSEQAGKLAFAHTRFFHSEPAEKLADLLINQALVT